MPDDGTSGTTAATGPDAAAPEDAALQEALAAAYAAIWGYGVVGAAVPPETRPAVATAEQAHRDVRDELLTLLSSRDVQPVSAEAAYDLRFPVLSAVDAAALAVTLEEGAATAWTWVLDQAAERGTRELAVAALTATELRAVVWRAQAGRTPVTTALPGLPTS
ncbi:ferritin-like domain-containing protein [Modestobacter sp. I12A-02662]|uniref:ferritin-like domain-containing protein n=1 Tax=Modestobacter sp. I12A-02662 TaxID=1730496 RepID=UPI0034E01360